MFFKAVIVVFCCLIFFSKAVAQSNQTEWKTSIYSDGRFSVKLPCQPIGFTQGPKFHVGGLVLNSFHMGCRRNDHKKFSVTRIQYKKSSASAPAADSYFENISRNKKWQVVGAKIVRGRFQDYPVLDISIRKSDQCFDARYILATPELFVLSVEAMDNKCEGLSALTAEFFPSLIFGAR